MSSPPIAMSKTKDELIKHLNLPLETYALMARETDLVYNWLIKERKHLKKNCRRKPPYDFSDFEERWKDDAMKEIARSGDRYTHYYWALGDCGEEGPNWVAKWFLYHKFRYRDGRNKSHRKDGDRSHGESSRSSRCQRTPPPIEDYSSYPTHPESSASYAYYAEGSYQQESSQAGTSPRDSDQGGVFYDPVRDTLG